DGALGRTLVDQHVIQPCAEVPDDEHQESNDQQGLERVVHRDAGRGAPGRRRAIIAGTGGGDVSRRGSAVFGWVLAVAGIALFTRLGFWQLERMHAKQAMLDAVANVLDRHQARPLAVAADPRRSTGYDWSAGDGRFADVPPILLDNQGRNERPGVRAYRVFLPDSGTPLLVELGWLPLPGDRTLPAVPLPANTMRVS